MPSTTLLFQLLPIRNKYDYKSNQRKGGMTVNSPCIDNPKDTSYYHVTVTGQSLQDSQIEKQTQNFFKYNLDLSLIHI